MRKKMIPISLLLALVALAASPAAAQRTVGQHGPLLVEVATETPVVFLSANTLPAFDLHLLMENISEDRTVTITRISGTLAFRGGLTTGFVLFDSTSNPEGGLTVPPGSGSAFFALLIVPEDAPTGGPWPTRRSNTRLAGDENGGG